MLLLSGSRGAGRPQGRYRPRWAPRSHGNCGNEGGHRSPGALRELRAPREIPALRAPREIPDPAEPWDRKVPEEKSARQESPAPQVPVGQWESRAPRGFRES